MVTKAGQEYRADLVIDAAGRRSPVPGWLEGGGYAPPPEVEVDPHVTYSSRLYRLAPQVGAHFPALFPSNLLLQAVEDSQSGQGLRLWGNVRQTFGRGDYVEALPQAIA